MGEEGWLTAKMALTACEFTARPGCLISLTSFRGVVSGVASTAASGGEEPVMPTISWEFIAGWRGKINDVVGVSGMALLVVAISLCGLQMAPSSPPEADESKREYTFLECCNSLS